MSFTIRQICLVADKLQPMIDDFSHVLSIKNCYSDPQVDFFGLENVLFPIGTDFIEIVAPIRDNTPAGRYLERRNGNGGYMVILQADSKEAQASSLARAKEMGIRVAFEGTLKTYHFIQLHPGDTGGSFLQIDYDSQNEHQGYWYNAGGNKWKGYVNDAEKLAHLARGGYIKAIYHPVNKKRRFKELIFAYHDTIKSQIRIKNKLKARFRTEGIPCSGTTVYSQNFRNEWRSKLPDNPIARLIADE